MRSEFGTLFTMSIWHRPSLDELKLAELHSVRMPDGGVPYLEFRVPLKVPSPSGEFRVGCSMPKVVRT
jgi:hypothetical protein